MARLLAVLVRTGAARVTARSRVRELLRRRRPARGPSHDAHFALRVDVTLGAASTRATLVGGAQADATAVGAAGVARSLLDGEVADPGAWMPEQVIDPSRFFAYLAPHGLGVELSQTTSPEP